MENDAAPIEVIDLIDDNNNNTNNASNGNKKTKKSKINNPPAYYKVIDVDYDGSCFFRSIYVAACNAKVDSKIVARLGSPLMARLNKHQAKKGLSPYTQSAHDMYLEFQDIAHKEDLFVRVLRHAVSHVILSKGNRNGTNNINNNNNNITIRKDYVRHTYQYLATLNSADAYQEVLKSFPHWFIQAFGEGLPASESEFRATVARAARAMSSWVAEMEVHIVQDLLWEMVKVKLVVLNSYPSPMTYKFDKDALYVINIKEEHYRAIMVLKDKKKKLKACPDDQLMNPYTARCVKRESCKGYELTVAGVKF
jgi:hypothetical protein